MALSPNPQSSDGAGPPPIVEDARGGVSASQPPAARTSSGEHRAELRRARLAMLLQGAVIACGALVAVAGAILSPARRR